MRAVLQDEFGDASVLRLAEIQRPEPIPTEILVRVRAAGVNPVDWKIRSGPGRASYLPLPLVLGWDVAGVVEEVAPTVTRFKPGDEVFGMPWFPRAASAYAEYVTAPARQFARKPAGISFAEAGALPLASLTAYQSLVDVAGLSAGQRVLIHAAAGGVGHIAVQIAAARGADVIGTAAAARHRMLTDLGAQQVVDYHDVNFEDVITDVDVVLDLVGGAYSIRSLRILRPGGMLISVPSDLPAGLFDAAAEADVRARGFLVEPDHTGLEELAELVDAGSLHVLLAESFDLTDVAKAHELLESGRASGKIVLTV
jgi:NADPH:quinone reductase-like Zn-dependent oxidoreductase